MRLPRRTPKATDPEPDDVEEVIPESLPFPAPTSDAEKAANIGAVLTSMGVVQRGNNLLRKEVKKLAGSNRRHRGWIIVSVCGLALDLALSGVVWYLYDRVDHNSSANVVNCRATVQVGKGFQDVFGPFLTEDAPDNPQTPDINEHDATIKFKTFIHDLASQDCDNPKAVTTSSSPVTRD